MPLAPWLRALNAVGTVAEATRFFRGVRDASKAPPATVGTGATDLETGLANVVVAALKEAFDRDRSRFELERDEREAFQARADQALRLERFRQAGTQALTQVRLLAIFGFTMWVASAAAAGYLAPVAPGAKVLLGLGWTALSASFAASFIAHHKLAAWLADEPDRSSMAHGLPRIAANTVLPWLLLTGFVLTAASLIVAV